MDKCYIIFLERRCALPLKQCSKNGRLHRYSKPRLYNLLSLLRDQPFSFEMDDEPRSYGSGIDIIDYVVYNICGSGNSLYLAMCKWTDCRPLPELAAEPQCHLHVPTSLYTILSPAPTHVRFNLALYTCILALAHSIP